MSVGAFSAAWVRDALGLPRGDAAVGGGGGGAPSLAFDAIATDTRSLRPGSLFVALAGERFDAHEFLPAAAAAGATGAVVRRGTPPVAGLMLFPVGDTLDALGRLAASRRRSFTGPVIAVTGGNGKTSTKEMLGAMIATRWRTHRTRANNNNRIGVPLSIIEAPPGTEALVLEAGANQRGEIAIYRDIIDPDIALVLNAGSAHLEGFGSVEGVVREKLSLVREVPLAIVGTTPPSLAPGARATARRVITAGLVAADVVPDQVTMTSDGRPTISIDGVTFTLAARGRHQAGNAMFAWAVGRDLRLDPSRMAAALEWASLPGGRGELTQHNGLTIVNDSYNANPQSFETAIALARQLRSGRRLVFVAGTMRELGSHAEPLHREVAGWLAALAPDVLALVGDFVAAFADFRAAFGGTLLEADTASALAHPLADCLDGDELIVLKGSRGVELEGVLPAIIARAGVAGGGRD